MKKYFLVALGGVVFLSVAVGQPVSALSTVDGLVGYFPFSGNANDESGVGNNGTAYGAQLASDRNGNENSAYRLDGSDDYIQLPRNASLFPTVFTISAWVNISEYSQDWNAGSVIYSNYGGDYNGLFFDVNPAGHVMVRIHSAASYSSEETIGASVVPKNEWHHVAGVYDGTNLSVYLDGKLDGATTPIYPYNPTARSADPTIGKPSWASCVGGSACFNGAIDEVRLYSKAFSDSEMRELFLATGGEENKVPIIIIPGIMGSQLLKGDELIWINKAKAISDIVSDSFLLDLKLDSNGENVNGIKVGDILREGLYTNIYGELIKKLEEEGYKEGVDLLVFPYDWRLDNRENAEALEALIGENPKVNIVAHSMGGIVTRAYVAENGSSRINKVIYLGTPQLGSVNAFNALSFDDGLIDHGLDVSKFLDNETLSELAKTFPSVYQLLPKFEFLSLDDGKTFLSLDQTYIKAFINTAHIDKFKEVQEKIFDDPNIKNVEQYQIVGSGIATIGGLNRREVRIKGQGVDKCWEPLVANGDLTVPVKDTASVLGSITKTIYAHNIEHQELPNNSRVGSLVTKILKNEPLKNEEGKDGGKYLIDGFSDTPLQLKDTLTWNTCSPVSVEIVDSEGNKDGINDQGGQNQDIPGSSFFSFNTSEGGFLPADGNYNIKLTAFDGGTFSFFLNEVNEQGEKIDTIEYNNIPIMKGSVGALELNSETSKPELKIDVEGDGVGDFILPPNEEMNTETSLKILERIVQNLEIKKGLKQALVNQVKIAERFIEKGRPQLAKLALARLEKEIKLLSRKKLPDRIQISKEDAEDLLDIIEKIKLSL